MSHPAHIIDLDQQWLICILDNFFPQVLFGDAKNKILDLLYIKRKWCVKSTHRGECVDSGKAPIGPVTCGSPDILVHLLATSANVAAPANETANEGCCWKASWQIQVAYYCPWIAGFKGKHAYVVTPMI